jgi:hypothetical protein
MGKVHEQIDERLAAWLTAEKKGPDCIAAYRAKHNTVSLDWLPGPA